MNENITIAKEQYENLLESIERINKRFEKFERISDVLANLLVPAQTVKAKLGLHKNTLTNNEKIDKFSELGKRETFVRVGELVAVKKRKGRGK